MKLFSYYPSCATVSSTRRTPPRHNCQCRINHTSAFEAASISIYLQYSSVPHNSSNRFSQSPHKVKLTVYPPRASGHFPGRVH